MPAVIIRILDALESVVDATTSKSQRDVLLRQGEMVLSSAQETVTDQNDLKDIVSRFNRLTDRINARNAPKSQDIL
jgi:uncharacterized membrane protein